MKAQGASPGWGRRPAHPALKGRNLAGDADSMGESHSVPPFQGGAHRGWAIGFHPSGTPSVTSTRGRKKAAG